MDSIADAFPLNATHRGILFHSLQCEEADVYLSVISLRIKGVLDTALLQQAWQHVFSHHASLRSSVVFDGLEEPLWVVHDSINPEWEFLDISSFTLAECERQEREALTTLLRTKFNFAAEALMKFTLITLDDNTHQLLWAVHHVLSDGWSTSVVLEDIATAYAACFRGEIPTLPPTLDYRRFLESQAKVNLEPIKEYWSVYLQNRGTTPLKLREPVRELAQVNKSAIETQIYIDDNLNHAIADAARRYETTSNVLLLGAWGFVLRDLCQHESPLFGVTLAGRSSGLRAVERGVGLYASTLPIYIDTMDTRKLKAWLSDIGKSLQEHANNDSLGLADIQKLAKLEANEALFTSVVALAGHESDIGFGSEKDGIQLDSIEYQIRGHFELSLIIKPGNRTSVKLVSQTDKLDQSSNDAILKRYSEVLDLLVDSTCKSVPELRQRWNQHEQEKPITGESATLPLYQTIDEWILDVAKQQPSNVAVVQGQESLTYAELEQKARQICQTLDVKLENRDDPIAICLSNSIDAIVVVIGVLLTGRSYIPINPQQPVERQAFLCQEADCALIVVERLVDSDASDINEFEWTENDDCSAKTITVDSLLAQAKFEQNTIQQSITHNEQSLAYLMYTSGSTGEPKSVAISHANLIYSTQARFDYYSKGVSKFLLVSPLHFDSSVVGLYWSLCSGGTIILPDKNCRNELSHWTDLVSMHGVTHVLCLPSVYRMWVRQSDKTDLESLENVIVAGEACDADLCSLHYKKLPDTVLYNEYGPTEACVWSSVHRCQPQESGLVPIGHPISGTSIRVIGIDGTVCPDGVEGELQLLSRGVSAGYYKRPDLTAQSFSSDPSSYKTGDLGYSSRYGQLYCTGRIDRQIKIRGQRIEPAEIELVARRIDSIDEVRAFSAMRHSGDRKKLWLAFSPKSVSVETMKSTVQAYLPESMWPYGYLALDSLPTLSNGKVSEQMLIDLIPDINSEEHPYEHSDQATVVENDLSNELLKMVNAIVGDKKATIVNNAVQCGLDSLDTMKLTAQLREKYAIELRLTSVLTSRNWGELALQIESLLNTDIKTSEAVSTEIDKKELPLSSQQLSLWFLDQTGIGPEVYAIQSTWRCVGEFSLPAAKHALNALVHQHEVLRTRLRIGNTGEANQVVLPPEPVEVTDVDRVSSSVTWEQAQDTQISRRFDFANDQLLRALVYRCSEDEILLMFHSHHIALDGWSFDVLHAQFADYYCQYVDVATDKSDSADHSVMVNMPAINEYQYGDYSLWQKRRQQYDLQSGIDHWCRVLAEPRETIELPLDFARPVRPSYKGSSVIQKIDQSTVECWSMLAQETQATAFMVALAAVKTGLRSVLGVNDLLIGTPVSNRTEPRWQNMLGFFGNTVVIRTKSVENGTLLDSVLQTRAATLDALQNENVPFDQIVRSLGLQGTTARHPLFDVFFMYTHQYDSAPTLPGVSVEIKNQTKLKTAKFDLAIEIRPTGQSLPNAYELHINYNVDLFNAITIERFATDLLSVMSTTAQQSSKPITETRPAVLPAVSNVSQNSQIETEHSDDSYLLTSQRLDQVFHDQSVNTPSSMAFQHNGVSVTYLELDHLVNRIAQCLHQSGIEPGEVVAVSLPRSIHQVAVALAVSRCEAVWCPIDPEYPQVRKSYMYSDSGSRFLIAAPETIADEASRTTMQHIVVDPAEKPANLVPNLVSLGDKKLQIVDVSATRYRHANQAAVLMYTSGSVGKPKGVLLSHHALMNRFVWMWNRYPFAENDVNVIKTSCSFVDSLWECFGALLAGAPSVLVDESDVTDIECFLSILRNDKVTRLLVVPSLLTAMLDWLAMYDQHLPDLRLCSCSGEVLPAHVAARLLAIQPHTRILNLYGSTEVTADVTCQEIVLTNETENLPLGSAISGVSIHILNEQHTTVVPGGSGEIAVAGLGLAIGYHGDMQLTAQKFIKLEGVGRVFLSGDIGHIDSSGRLHFEGRKDRQIKVRGIRVNCHEIEQQINSIAGVANSLVFAQGELTERHLCAVVQSNDSKSDSISINKVELSKQLQQLLPVHQVPDRYLLVDALPLLPNGKPDRDAAVVLMRDPGTISESFTQAVSDGINSLVSISDQSSSSERGIQQKLQKSMLAIWQDILHNHNLTANDDFFDAGGYSLLAVKLVMKVNTEVLAPYELQMTIGDLLEQRTVSNIVNHQGEIFIKAGKGTKLEVDTGANLSEPRKKYLMTLQVGTGTQQLFMVPPFGDTGFFFRNFTSCIPKKTSVYSFDMALSINHDSLQSLCSTLVSELLVVQPNGPWVIAAGCLGNILALEMARQLKNRTGHECDLYLIDSNPPKEGPGWKRVRERRTGLNLYWSIIRREFSEDYCRKLILMKVREGRAVFDTGIRKYLDVQVAQSNQYLEYKGQRGSANITFFRSSTFMKRPYVIERWALLTTGRFKFYDFPKVTHEKLLMSDSPHWSRIASIVLKSQYLQIDNQANVSTTGRKSPAQKHGNTLDKDTSDSSLDII